jgi:hypothetical protein
MKDWNRDCVQLCQKKFTCLHSLGHWDSSCSKWMTLGSFSSRGGDGTSWKEIEESAHSTLVRKLLVPCRIFCNDWLPILSQTVSCRNWYLLPSPVHLCLV